jgi:predicted RNA-binding Zn ribbon-like protein
MYHPETEAQEPTGDFVFLGGPLAIDLVNSEVVVRGRARDLLASPERLAVWQAEARAHHPEAAIAPTASALDDSALRAIKELRAALRAMFTAIVDGRPVGEADLGLLNQILRGSHQVVRVADDGRFRASYEGDADGVTGLLLAIARSAFDLLTGQDLTRLHHCANPRCVLFFYDTTKSATRRWCSVACMDRARSSARYRARQQTATGTAT